MQPISETVNQTPPPDHENVFEVIREAEGLGGTLVVSTRRRQPELQLPKLRRHHFHQISSLVAYVKAFVEPPRDAVAIYVDVDRLQVVAVLDEAEGPLERGGVDNVLTFAPKPHPRWTPWGDFAGRWHALPDMIEFLREQRRSISEADNHRRDLLFALAQVRASTSVELEQGATANSSVNALRVETRITAREGGAPEAVDLPDEIVVNVPLFCGDHARSVRLGLDLRAVQGGTAIQAQLNTADVVAAELEAFEQAARNVAYDFEGEKGERPNVFYGHPSFVDKEVRA